MTSPQLMNAAEDLQGVRLLDGWTVERRVPDRPGATGGHFSISYMARFLIVGGVMVVQAGAGAGIYAPEDLAVVRPEDVDPQTVAAIRKRTG